MGYDRQYLVWALAYVAAGLGLGIYLAASHDPTQFDTHAHVLLVGFVLSFLYAVIHKLWLGDRPMLFAGAQFVAHQAGALGMSVGLFLLHGGIVPPKQIEPVLGVSSIAVLVAALLMIVMVLRHGR